MIRTGVDHILHISISIADDLQSFPRGTVHAQLVQIPVLSLTSWVLWHAQPYALPPALLVAIVLQAKPYLHSAGLPEAVKPPSVHTAPSTSSFRCFDDYVNSKASPYLRLLLQVGHDCCRAHGRVHVCCACTHLDELRRCGVFLNLCILRITCRLLAGAAPRDPDEGGQQSPMDGGGRKGDAQDQAEHQPEGKRVLWREPE